MRPHRRRRGDHVKFKFIFHAESVPVREVDRLAAGVPLLRAEEVSRGVALLLDAPRRSHEDGLCGTTDAVRTASSAKKKRPTSIIPGDESKAPHGTPRARQAVVLIIYKFVRQVAKVETEHRRFQAS